MPNIKQQKKRVRIAARQRMENLRYRSTIKTLTRRLENAVAEGDAAAVEQERRSLEHWLDRAAARGAVHRNKAARRKTQASRLVATAAPAAPATAPRREQPAEAAAEPKAKPEKPKAEKASRGRGLRRSKPADG